MRLTVVRVLAVLLALSWLVFPGFGVIDLSVSWDPGWPVVLEAGWGVFMTVLVGGSFLAVAVRPHRAAPALVVLGVALATMLVGVAVGPEPWLLVYAGLLLGESLAVAALLPRREPLRPVRLAPSWPLLALAAAAAGPWLVHAVRLLQADHAGAGRVIGDVTNGVDHYAVQGALALTLVVLSLTAACWPRGRTHLGVAAGLSAAYLGLVSAAFPGTPAGLGRTWSLLCLTWGAALALLAWTTPRLQGAQLRGEVVEAERPL